MIYFVTALYQEAHPLIEHYKLSKMVDAHPFTMFGNEQAGIRLLVTGTGMTAAAACVAGTGARYRMNDRDFLINVGICAMLQEEKQGASDDIGRIFLCNKLTEQVSGRTYYPDLLYPQAFGEMPLMTGACVWQGGPIGYQTLYDMEASAVYQAGSYFLGPHQMSFLKIVSDTGQGNRISPEEAERLVTDRLEEITAYADMLLKVSEETQPPKVPQEDALLEQLCADMHCSKVMRDTMRQYWYYGGLSGVDRKALVEEWYHQGLLPCRDKREGKQRLMEYQEKLLAQSPVQTDRRYQRPEGYQPAFSHIYVEQEVLKHPRTLRILKQFPRAKVIPVTHYKDVFCRRHQSVEKQHHTQNLILAARHGSQIYEGAPVCQSFGNQYFYYCSCVMNCVFNCEYCYLKGMYPSANLVVFVNLEDLFEEVEHMLCRHPVYLCVSYDTDLLALEHVLGYTRSWMDFTGAHENLTIEVRTKSAGGEFFRQQTAAERVVFAFTISPQAVIDRYEHGTPGLAQRIACVQTALEAGFQVRLCFDPMIYCADWKQEYGSMMEQILNGVDMSKLLDVSIGSFRISQDYLKKMRKQEPCSAVVQFPFENKGGVYQYQTKLQEQMEECLMEWLLKEIPKEKIFLWER